MYSKLGWFYFRQLNSRSSAPRVWEIKVEGNVIHTRWGMLGGAMQEAKDIMKGVNLGKKNEISPEAYALDRMEEIVRKKKREGYRQFSYDGELIDTEVSVDIDFSNLGESLCFYKPDNTMGAGMLKKAEQGKVFYARKRNGLMYVLSKDEKGVVRMFSRRMLRAHDLQPEEYWEKRFPYIRDVAALLMPNKSIMLGEIVFDMKGVDDFKMAQVLTKTLYPEVMAKQLEAIHLGNAAFYVWDIAFWDGIDLVSTTTVRSRYELIHEAIEPGPHILPIEFYPESYFKTPAEAVEYAKTKGFEGWVVVDPEGVYGEKAYNFRGKPDRPGSYCSKLKPEYEDDFIAYWDPEKGKDWGEVSTKGRYDGGIKSVALYQYNLKGKLIYIANCASGMTEEMKKDWAKGKSWPQVWKVIYTDRRYISQGDETNAIDFPRFEVVRDDKTPQECINPIL